MAFLNVAGSPIAPSGLVIRQATLTVVLQDEFQDGTHSYPRFHYGLWEPGDVSWRAENTAVGSNIPFQVPGKGAADTTLTAPTVRIIEHHFYQDGSQQIFSRFSTVTDNGVGNWNYAAP